MTTPVPYFQTDDVTLYCGDCLEILPHLGKVDCVVTDPPYGTTNLKWDKWVCDKGWFESCFAKMENGRPVIMFVSGHALLYALRAAGEWFRYKFAWDRVGKVTGALDANRRPLRRHEDILVFSAGRSARYFVSKVKAEVGRRGNTATEGNNVGSGLYGKKRKRLTWHDTGERFPVDVFRDTGVDSRRREHPTQKPTGVLERLCMMYSQPSETILDPFMGSGTTGVACVKTGRKFIGIELDPAYCEIAKQRIEKAIAERAGNLATSG
jgi:DNA modification methylase